MNKIRLAYKIIVVIAFSLFLSSTATAVDFHGWSIPDTLNAEDSTLVLNGVGFRSKFFFNIYAGALYLPEKETNPDKIIMADEYMGVRMHFTFRKVGSDTLIDILETGFDNSTNGNIAPIQKQIDHLFDLLPNEFHKNDIVDLVYVPSRGIVTTINGEYAGECPGLNFKQAVLGIWLGEKPVTEKLKEEMLGVRKS